MKFLITMNMQSRSGNPTHQVICRVYGAEDLSDLHEMLGQVDFIRAEEFYRKQEGGFYSVGEILLNTMHIGKVKVSPA